MIPDEVLDALAPREFEPRWARRLAEAETGTVVAVDAEGRVTGFALTLASRDDDAPPPEVGELWAIYVEPEAWGRGVGLALWRSAREVLLAGGYAEVVVWVLADNRRARAFYERVGFVLDPGVSRTFEFRGAALPEVRYRLRLR